MEQVNLFWVRHLVRLPARLLVNSYQKKWKKTKILTKTFLNTKMMAAMNVVAKTVYAKKKMK